MSLTRILPSGRRALTALVLALLATAVLGGGAVASELRAAAVSGSGILIHDADETLRDFCRSENGRLYLVLPGGSRWELVTSTSDAVVTNPGDGAFHAFDPAEVSAALAAVRFPLHHVSAEVFILPFPRRLSLESAAGPGLVLLSPGVRPLSREHQHSEFVHELGHVVQYALLPDANADGWSEYARLRGIDAARFNASATHANRPHEIWAEDFRALFGGASANSNGTIENAALSYPTQVQGLSAFMQGVAAGVSGRPATRLTASAFAWGALSFARGGTIGSLLDVYDASGRRLAALEPSVNANGVSWRWDGRDASGQLVRGTVVFARPRDGDGGTARVVRLP
jgi:hypothetical protein